MNKAKLVAEIMYLSVLVNANTDLCVFASFSGHINEVSLRIADSKENFGAIIFDDHGYTDCDWAEKGIKTVEALKDKLVHILQLHNVPYEQLLSDVPECLCEESEPAIQ